QDPPRHSIHHQMMDHQQQSSPLLFSQLILHCFDQPPLFQIQTPLRLLHRTFPFFLLLCLVQSLQIPPLVHSFPCFCFTPLLPPPPPLLIPHPQRIVLPH